MRYAFALLICVLAFRAPAAPPTTAPYECHWTDHPIAIDGTADDPAWKDAAVIEFHVPWNPPDQRKPREATHAKLLWDADYLYFYADMDDADLFAFGRKHNDHLWNGDVFELFFKPIADQFAYYEFEVNPADLTLELAFPDKASVAKTDETAAKTKIAMKTAVKVRGAVNRGGDKVDGWSVSGRIPWKDLTLTGGRPKDGAVWTFALNRWNHSTPPSKVEEGSSSAPLTQKSFHRVQDYAPLKFVGAEAEKK